MENKTSSAFPSARILGIESSCDETAAAVDVNRGAGAQRAGDVQVAASGVITNVDRPTQGANFGNRGHAQGPGTQYREVVVMASVGDVGKAGPRGGVGG